MNLQSLVEDSYDLLLQQAEEAKIVLLHPQSRYRSMVVAKLLADAPCSVFYYSMGPYDVNVVSFLSGFCHDLADQHPTFGRHLNQLGVENEQHDSNALLDALYHDLSELSEDRYFLVLDEYDASENADDVQEFLEKMILNLPANCQVVINSRTLPRLPWVALIAAHQAVILKDSEIISDDPYQIQREGNLATLHVQSLGPGLIIKDNEPIDEWEGHLPRLLFIFALERPVVTRAEICQAFWPNLDNDQAVNVFHVTKRRLHKALGFDALVHQDGYYMVNPQVSIRYDVVEFVNALVRGRTLNGTEAAQAWQQAIDLYRGPFLQGHTDHWVVQQRQAYKSGYLEAMMAIASLRLEADRPEHALRILLQATAENEDYEELHREIMRIYAGLGRRSEAAAHYQSLVENLKHRGMQPEQQTLALYEKLMS
jgi:DNA-binding SARP family transcriptional activator